MFQITVYNLHAKNIMLGQKMALMGTDSGVSLQKNNIKMS